MVGDPSRHGWRCLLDGVETLVRRAKVIDRAHQEHPLVQGQGLACQRPAPARQRREAFPERRVQPLDVRCIDDAVALRAPSERLDAGGRAVDNAAVSLDDTAPLVVLEHLVDQDVAPGAQPGPAALACGPGVATGSAESPDVRASPISLRIY